MKRRDFTLASVIGLTTYGEPSIAKTLNGNKANNPIILNCVAELRDLNSEDINLVYLTGYYQMDDGGGGVFYKIFDSSRSGFIDNGGTIIMPSGGDGLTAWKRHFDNEINVKAFGAKGDGNHDDTAQIQSSINVIKNIGGIIRFPPGIYKVTNELNVTNNSNRSITFLGSGRRTTSIHAYHDGHVFDCTGSQFLLFEDFSVWGMSPMPQTAFFFARNETNSSSGQNYLVRVQVNGKFSAAAIYNYAAEEFHMSDCYCTNSSNDACVLQITRDNILNLKSNFSRVSKGSQSTTEYHFSGCAFNSYAESGEHAAISLQGVGSISFSKLFCINKSINGYFIMLDNSLYIQQEISFNDVMLDGAGAVIGFYLKGQMECLGLTIRNVLNYGIHSGHMFYASLGTKLNFLTYESISNPQKFLAYNINFASITQYGPLHIVKNITNSSVRTQNANYRVGRPDLSVGNEIIFTDTAYRTISGSIKLDQMSWDKTTLQMGNYTLWVDLKGRLRIKHGSPTSDLDGNIVGDYND
jgi:hypothetical protein